MVKDRSKRLLTINICFDLPNDYPDFSVIRGTRTRVDKIR